MLTQSFCRIFYFIAVLISTIKAQYCTAQEDCTSPTASFCDLGNLQCVPCSVSSDCAHLTKEHICDNLRCYECLTTPDCQTIYNDVLISCDATNYCEEPCGDGINSGLVECDDGNLISGDGCDGTCFIEPGYICFGGDKTVSDSCVKIPPAGTIAPNVYGKEIGMGKILLYFDQPMIIKRDMPKLVDVKLYDTFLTQHIKSYKVSKYTGPMYDGQFNQYLITYISDIDFNKEQNVTITVGPDQAIRAETGLALASNTTMVKVSYYYQEINGIFKNNKSNH